MPAQDENTTPELKIEAPAETPTSETSKTVETPPEAPPAKPAVEANTEETPRVPDANVEFEDFVQRRAGVIKKPAEKPAEKPTGEDSKVSLENKPVKSVVESRDLTIFDEADREIFKRMSNDAFNKVKEIYKSNKELQTKLQEQEKLHKEARTKTLPDSYYSHPQGYVLSEDYTNAVSAHSKAQLVREHWEKQLDNIAKGEPWQDLDADQKTGEIFILDKELEPTESARIAVKKQLEQAIEWEVKYRSQAQNIAGTFRQQYENDLNFIKQTESKFFPDYDKPDHKTRKLQDGLINLLPASYRGHPLASLLAKTVANNALFAAENKALREENTKLKGQTKRTEQPTKANFVSDGGKSAPDISYEDFVKRRAGVPI